MRLQPARKGFRDMSKRTTIYVLFKEYPDPNGRGKSAPYIQDSVDYLMYQDELLRDGMDIFDVLKYFSYEQTSKYYDDSNLEGLLDVAQQFPNEYPKAVETIMSGIQRVGLTSRSMSPVPKSNTYHLGLYNVTNDLLGDMAQCEFEHREVLDRVKHDVNHQLLPQDKEYDSCVLLQHGAVIAPGGMLRISMSGNRVLELQSVSNISDLHQWLRLHRYPYRHYVFNEKHGDAHRLSQNHTDRHGRIVRSAQLLTSTGKTRALLKEAVGDDMWGDLWFYDDANACYIYFENQGNTPQHEYHAYHLHPGEKNFDKINFEKLRVVLPHIP